MVLRKGFSGVVEGFPGSALDGGVRKVSETLRSLQAPLLRGSRWFKGTSATTLGDNGALLLDIYTYVYKYNSKQIHRYVENVGLLCETLSRNSHTHIC